MKSTRTRGVPEHTDSTPPLPFHPSFHLLSNIGIFPLSLARVPLLSFLPLECGYILLPKPLAPAPARESLDIDRGSSSVTFPIVGLQT